MLKLVKCRTFTAVLIKLSGSAVRSIKPSLNTGKRICTAYCTPW